MPTAQEQQVLLDLRRGLESLYGDRLADLILFGSRARGDADTDSDYDVLVVLRGDVDVNSEFVRTSEPVGAICLHHDVLITCVYVSESDFQYGASPLMLNVRAEGVTL